MFQLPFLICLLSQFFAGVQTDITSMQPLPSLAEGDEKVALADSAVEHDTKLQVCKLNV